MERDFFYQWPDTVLIKKMRQLLAWIVGVAGVGWLLQDEKDATQVAARRVRKKKMQSTKRVFLSFAIDDVTSRDLIVGQSRNSRTPFAFVDMSVKTPWDEKWKTKCRARIKRCDGVIVLVTTHTSEADGAMWEIRCAKEEGIPVIGVYCSESNRPWFAPHGIKMIEWTWSSIADFVDSL